jgi:predicted DNA-binding transcriptional regulator AlpA
MMKAEAPMLMANDVASCKMPSGNMADAEPRAKFFASEEVRLMIGICRSTFYNWQSAGIIPGYSKPKRKVFWHRQTILDWLEAGMPGVRRKTNSCRSK